MLPVGKVRFCALTAAITSRGESHASAHEVEPVRDDALLPSELCRICPVLDLAPAAFPEHRAERFGAFRRFDQQLNEAGDGVLGLDVGNLDQSAFAGKRTKTKYHQAGMPADGLSVGEKIVEIEFEPLTGSWRSVRLSCRVDRQGS